MHVKGSMTQNVKESMTPNSKGSMTPNVEGYMTQNEKVIEITHGTNAILSCNCTN